MGSFLEQFNDPGIAVDLAWDLDAYVTEQRQRITRQAAVALHAHQIPRRLGGDATREELAQDKKVCRKVQQRSTTALINWGGQPADITELANNDATTHQEGAQIQWPAWYLTYRPKMQTALRFAATHAIRTGHIKEGNKFVNRLYNELATLDQILGTHTG